VDTVIGHSEQATVSQGMTEVAFFKTTQLIIVIFCTWWTSLHVDIQNTWVQWHLVDIFLILVSCFWCQCFCCKNQLQNLMCF